MSDPRIYHRVGPVAPEGRQIYDDIRRRDSTIESQINSLSVTTVSVGVVSGESSTITIGASLEATISTITVTPVTEGPFIIRVQCFLESPGAVGILAGRIDEGSTTIDTLFTGLAVGSFDTHYVPFMKDVLVENSDTSVRTFDVIASRGSGSSITFDRYGTTQAFQWTVA